MWSFPGRVHGQHLAKKHGFFDGAIFKMTSKHVNPRKDILTWAQSCAQALNHGGRTILYDIISFPSSIPQKTKKHIVLATSYSRFRRTDASAVPTPHDGKHLAD
jgi:hypothetical protein